MRHTFNNIGIQKIDLEDRAKGQAQADCVRDEQIITMRDEVTRRVGDELLQGRIEKDEIKQLGNVQNMEMGYQRKFVRGR